MRILLERKGFRKIYKIVGLGYFMKAKLTSARELELVLNGSDDEIAVLARAALESDLFYSDGKYAGMKCVLSYRSDLPVPMLVEFVPEDFKNFKDVKMMRVSMGADIYRVLFADRKLRYNNRGLIHIGLSESLQM